MKKNDVVTVVTVSGEYIGKYEKESAGVIYLTDPRMLIAGDQVVGFARGICMTGTENPTHCAFQQYVYVTETNPDFAKAYREAVSGLQLV